MEEDNSGLLIQSLIDVVNEIAWISDFRYTVKKQYCNLSRRLKLLIPMFEEIRDSKDRITEDTLKALVLLKEALESAKKLLRFGSEGKYCIIEAASRNSVFLVLFASSFLAPNSRDRENRAVEREQIMNKFHEVTAQLEQALEGIAYDKLDISDEVKEQVELVLAQFRRARGRAEAPDSELSEDILALNNMSNDSSIDQDRLRRLSEKLQLIGISDLTQESIALHEMVAATDGDPGQSIEKMAGLLKKIKDFVQTENLETEAPSRDKSPPASCSGHVSNDKNNKTPIIPDDFRCPISLELMRDPVIVSTGQTYERSCIEKWLEAGHVTCPKTQQNLSSTTLTPNYVLRSLIAQWCEANGIEPPKRPSSARTCRSSSSCSAAERTKIDILLCKLASGNPEDQRSAAGEIRLLAKRNADNRVAIAEAGAIPLLVGLLSTPDSRVQEHAVTALLNLSICEDNKGSIISSGAVPGIVLVLKKGSMEARENAAATLFSLSVVDENKVRIGASGAIPPLVTLLSEGTQRGKKDAATALFNLCIYQGNKGKAVRAGVVPTLMQLLTEPGTGMVDEALAILAILASHPEGKAAIRSAKAVPVLVDVIGTGSPRNRENAAAVLVHLCSGDEQHLVEARELGVISSLIDLARNGTDRGKRKAAQLLERINRLFEHAAAHPEEVRVLRLQTSESQPQSQPSQSTSTTEVVGS
ncbi:U-box domain-containing protein 13-like [Cucumis melo var. makuwa]|uniref:RING-type E3 ubiquitin transferase n=1 Tax=Cucumis melo var. makuwa TaxID=1194695 RepID=A0A5A7VME9_CUCMM|nr:U-box domain-containing protein 13-like [Cucumis melo var. makuwa]